MTTDRVILYYTANRIAEPFAESIRDHLLTTSIISRNGIINTIPIVTISQKPLDFGINVCVGELGHSAWLVYWQILQGAKAARELKAKWVICCEDDSLYHLEHFQFTPPKDAFYYNANRWIIEDHGGKPLPHFRFRDRISMVGCIAPTDLMIETLETKFKKFPEPILKTYDLRLRGWGEPGRYEWYLKLPKVPSDSFETLDPIITFNHKKGLGGLRKQKEGDIIQIDLPPWGPAAELWSSYYGD